MNIVNKVTLKHLLMNKKRTIVTIIGVILSVAMITAVLTFAVSIVEMLRQEAILSNGNWHVQIPDIPVQGVETIAKNSNTDQSFVFKNVGFSEITDPKNTRKPYLFLSQYNETAFKNYNIKLSEGRMPAKAGEILISEGLLENSDYKVGDTLSLTIGKRIVNEAGQEIELGQSDVMHTDDNGNANEKIVGELERELTIVGVVNQPPGEVNWSPAYLLIEYLDINTLEAGQTVNAGVLYKNFSGDIQQESEALAQAAGAQPEYLEDGSTYYEVRYNDALLQWSGITGNTRVDSTIFWLEFIAILIILLGSISLIYNAFSISISERSRYMGMLASVGATRKQKRNSVFFESFAIGMISIPIGLILGTAGIGLVMMIVSPLMQNLSGSKDVVMTLTLSYEAIALAVVFSVVTLIVSAYIPARRASKISPIRAIMQTSDIKLSARKVKTSRLTRWLFGFEAELALKNLKRNKRRYRSTIFSLIISIVLFLTVSSYATIIRNASNFATGDVNFDISVSAPHNKDQQAVLHFYQTAGKIKGVTDFSIQYTMYGETRIPKDKVSQYVKENGKDYIDTQSGQGNPENEIRFMSSVIGLDDQSFEKYAKEIGAENINFLEKDKCNAIVVNNMMTQSPDGKKVQTDILAMKQGESIPVMDSAGDPANQRQIGNFTVGTLTDKLPLGVSGIQSFEIKIIIPMSAYNLLLNKPGQETNHNMELYVSAEDAADVEKKIIQTGEDQGIKNLQVYNLATVKDQSNQMMFMLEFLVYGFILLITSICIANIFNTISTSIKMRTREFAMLKSAGMTPRSFNKMINYESVFYGIKALIYGLPISTCVIWFLNSVLSGGFEMSFIFPLNSVAIVIVSVFIIVFSTMLYSSSKVKKENIIDALKHENI